MYFIKRLRQAALGIAGLFSVPFGKKVEKSLSKIIDDKPTIYDEKIDQFYNETHIGGFTHRHFDGHSPFEPIPNFIDLGHRIRVESHHHQGIQ